MWTAEPATIQGMKKARKNQLKSTRKVMGHLSIVLIGA